MSDHLAEKAERSSPWHRGALFHNAKRYPRKEGANRVDRLAPVVGLLDALWARRRLAEPPVPLELVRSA